MFLLGAPGIGKTAIMEQIAQELEVGFVSYSMTHHTRQSALGLPFIATKTYDGGEYQVSEYTTVSYTHLTAKRSCSFCPGASLHPQARWGHHLPA